MQLIITFLLVPLLQMLVAVIATLPAWVLWNWIAVSVFELPAISFLQTFGLLLLLSLLFGSKLTIERS
ncbi:MAG TPA: hypothetical protein PKH39_15130 [Woeseiaceae bacterium]|nr:hypothetical protein [Woeseiaceae bacterium]